MHTLSKANPLKDGKHWRNISEAWRSLQRPSRRPLDLSLGGTWPACGTNLGKYQLEFQQRLFGSRVSVEHSGAGAALAVKGKRDCGTPLAFVIAGHHAGLANLAESEVGLPSPLQERLRENAPTIDRTLPAIPDEITGRPALRERRYSKRTGAILEAISSHAFSCSH